MNIGAHRQLYWGGRVLSAIAMVGVLTATFLMGGCAAPARHDPARVDRGPVQVKPTKVPSYGCIVDNFEAYWRGLPCPCYRPNPWTGEPCPEKK